jgi:hypothetical protein
MAPSIVYYYVLRNGDQFGPLSIEQLTQFVTARLFRLSDLVWKSDMGTMGWIPLSTLQGADKVPVFAASLSSEVHFSEADHPTPFCPKCGAGLLADYAKFCNSCGVAISTKAPAPEAATLTFLGAQPQNLIDQLPARLERLLAEMLGPDEIVHIKLKGAFKEALVCTNKRVLILKAGFMTGQTFGSNVFQVPYRNITGVQVKKHLITGYFEISAGGVQNQPTSYWQTGQSSAANRENCISLNSGDAFARFREASGFILSRCN